MDTIDSFADRLAAARATVAAARIAPRPAVWVLDQLDAAANDARCKTVLMGVAAQLVEPDRNWRYVAGIDESRVDVDEVAARMLAAASGTRSCPHLRRPHAPQVSYARLPIHRTDCARCVRTFVKPPPDEDDRCDWCGVRDVVMFTPAVFNMGPSVVIGDACRDCAVALHIDRRVPS